MLGPSNTVGDLWHCQEGPENATKCGMNLQIAASRCCRKEYLQSTVGKAKNFLVYLAARSRMILLFERVFSGQLGP